MRFIVTIPDRILDEEYPDLGEQQLCDEIRDTLGGEMSGSYKDITVVADAGYVLPDNPDHYGLERPKKKR